MKHGYVILVMSLSAFMCGCASAPVVFKPSEFGLGLTPESLLRDAPKTQESNRQVLSGEWFIRVFDFQITAADAPALFAQWKEHIEGSLRSSGIEFTHNRAQPPNLELIYWPSRLTGTVHLFMTALPDGKARVTGVVYEYPNHGQQPPAN